jgi:CBS domain-containing protein
MGIKKRLVKDWMSSNPVTISPKTTVAHAHDLMTQHNFRHIPVVEDDSLVGIISLGDIRESGPSEVSSLSIYELNFLLANTEVKEVMSAKPYFIGAEEKLSAAARVMLDHKIAGLPVVSDGKVIGILTESDIFQAVIEVFDS